MITLKITLSKFIAFSLIVCLLILSMPIANVFADATVKYEDTIASKTVGSSTDIGLPFYDNEQTVAKKNSFKVVEEPDGVGTAKCIKMTHNGLGGDTLFINVDKRTAPLSISGNVFILETMMKLDYTSGNATSIQISCSSSMIKYSITPSTVSNAFPNQWANVKIIGNKTTGKYGVYINNVLSLENTCDPNFFTTTVNNVTSGGMSLIRIFNENKASDLVQRSAFIKYLKIYDISAFDITSVVPSNNSFDIDPSTDKMTVNFTNSVDSSTFNASNVLLYKNNGTVQVPITTSASGTQGIINLPVPLDNSVDYTLTVKSTVKDIYIQPMIRDRIYKFIVKDNTGIEVQPVTFSCGSTLVAGNLTGTIPLKNTTNNAIQATVIFALYKVDSTTGFDIYTDSVTQIKMINANTTEEYRDWSLNVPNDFSNYIVKAYIWDKFDQLGVPLAEPITLSKNGIQYADIQGSIAYSPQANFEATELDKTGVVRVSGKANIPGKRVSIIVNDPMGKILYIGQTKSVVNGQQFNYEHKYKLSDKTTTGAYSAFSNIYYGFTGNASNFNTSFNIDTSWYPVIASNVSLTSTPIVGEMVEAKYDYLNGLSIQEGNSVYRWLIGERPDSELVVIPNVTGKTYTPTEADAYKVIMFEVTPYAKGVAQGGQVVLSEPYMVLTYPEARNVTVTGSGVMGNVLEGDYTYYQKVNNPESSDTKYIWLRSDSANGTYTEIAQGITYIPTVNDVGKYIKFQVTPYSSIEPKVGKPISSDYKLITAPVKSNTSSGGTGGGRTVVISNPVIQPSPTPTATSEPSKSTFSDIGGHWAEKDVLEMSSRGITKGDNGKFMPDVEINRAGFVALVVRVLKLSSSDYKNEFSDVSANEWYAKEIQSAVDAELVSGDNHVFRPNDFVTREEMTKIIMQAFKKIKGNIPNEGDLSNFSDATDISAWAEDFVRSAYSLGLVNGLENKSFNPKGNATRAQAVVIIKRLTEILAAK